jgi:hypothetical protein
MLCERSRMLLKGDEGGAKFGRGGGRSPGGSGCSLPCAEWRVGAVVGVVGLELGNVVLRKCLANSLVCWSVLVQRIFAGVVAKRVRLAAEPASIVGRVQPKRPRRNTTIRKSRDHGSHGTVKGLRTIILNSDKRLV